MSSTRCFRRIRSSSLLQIGQRSWRKLVAARAPCVNQSQGKKPTLSHLNRQLPNTEGTRPLPGAPRPRKTALPNRKHMQKALWLDDSWCCCSMKIHQPPQDWHTHLQMICHTEINNISKLQLLVYDLPWFYVHKRDEGNTWQMLLTQFWYHMLAERSHTRECLQHCYREVQ